ncbi:Conserved oligomeric Golgi complex subunit 1 [Phytophthora citrophthora]|uniref:Conserved oligomeric Golgi complex subunit 1 n=1 Tax=Phytophthora citrophthora TaxID=4793 RepID=A0AAD9GJ01_9STRA|nr:Conserved oligomeric Golgi complex subunit 1 [Phytophthora citrophthora]
MAYNLQSSMASAGDAADFLRRLSIADAKVLLERTRKEKENKTKEMQKMIGVRYRDLIESADKIVNMHSAALRLEVSLKEMPEMWKQMEQALATALYVEDSPVLDEKEAEKSMEPQLGVLSEDATATDKAAFLVDVPEKMWQLLDEGESLLALDLYGLAAKIHTECMEKTVEQEFPFLQTQWTCIQRFRPRMVVCARNYLTCRGKESRFYADNLCTLAVLNDPPIGPEELFEVYLESRSKWMTPIHKQDEEKLTSQKALKKERALTIILKSISMTMTQTEEIFGNSDKTGLLNLLSQLPANFKEGMLQFILSGKMLKRLNGWFQRKQRQILEVASPIISSIDTIAQLSRVQSRLYAVNKDSGSCQNVKLWGQVLIDTSGDLDKQLSLPVDSVFSVLFAETFRKRTRDLVQHSFVEALEAIKTQIRSSLEDTVANVSRSEYRLRNVKFYNYFETIQKKAADLDASDLQGVLIEEFLRTLFKLVLFFEQEYPLPGNQKFDTANGSVQVPSVFLSISNILAGIVAGFHRKMSKLFPGISATVSIPERDPSLPLVGQAFEKYSSNGFMKKSQLESALADILGGEVKSLTCFIDEELNQVNDVGFHSLYLVAEIKRKASYPQLFVNALHGLSKRYCEAWATILLEQKIEPLRELLRVEQYDTTNEEWIATHEGWVEQVISDEGLGGDTDDSSSESEMALGDEKVWLPWCETPTVSSFLFSCCYSLDDANRLVQNSVGTTDEQIKLMQCTIREVLVEQLTLVSVAVYNPAVSLLMEAKAIQKDSVLNFGECCVQQFLFDLYFVRATLGFSDFIRFGWGDELNPEECSPGLLKLKSLFERMREFIDPVDWEIYGPQLIENVVLQFRKSRLLFSSLSESNDINKINGKEIVIGAQDTRPLARIAEPVSRFSLLPVPSSRRKFQRTMSSTSRSSDSDATDGRSRPNSSTLFHERIGTEDASQSSAVKLQNLLSSSTSSNLFSAATSGNLLSSAAKGMGFLSSATTNKYF